MPKRKTTSTTTNSVSAVTKAATGHTVPTNVKFPELSTKKGLECRVLMEDQVLLIDNLFSVDECKRFVKFIDELPLELTPPKKRGEAERMNHRISIISPDFAARLFDVIGPHLPNFPYPASVATKARATARTGHSLNSNIRMYKYTPNQHFGPHYDDAVVDPSGNGSRSEWTLLIYLTGVEDGVKGGETVFYLDNKMKKQVKAPLNRGTALLHRYECFRPSQPPILVLTHLIRQRTRTRVFTSRGLKGREWYEVHPTLRSYVCKLITRAICQGYVEMSFKRGNFGKL